MRFLVLTYGWELRREGWTRTGHRVRVRYMGIRHVQVWDFTELWPLTETI